MKFPYLSISLIGFNSSYLEIITKLSIVPLFAGEITAKIKKKKPFWLHHLLSLIHSIEVLLAIVSISIFHWIQFSLTNIAAI